MIINTFFFFSVCIILQYYNICMAILFYQTNGYSARKCFDVGDYVFVHADRVTLQIGTYRITINFTGFVTLTDQFQIYNRQLISLLKVNNCYRRPLTLVIIYQSDSLLDRISCRINIGNKFEIFIYFYLYLFTIVRILHKCQ